MNHYIYKITNQQTGEYYIGMRSTRIKIEDDKYMGSGNWIKSIDNGNKKSLFKEVLEVCGCRKELMERERHIISKHLLLPLNMNLCDGGEGGNFVSHNNPKYDNTEYVLFNNDLKEMVTTKLEARELGIDVWGLSTGKYLHSRGWFYNGVSGKPLYSKSECLDIIKNSKKSANRSSVIYIFEHKSGKHIVANPIDMSLESGISRSAISTMIHHGKGCRGWVCKGRKEDVSVSSDSYD